MKNCVPIAGIIKKIYLSNLKNHIKPDFPGKTSEILGQVSSQASKIFEKNRHLIKTKLDNNHVMIGSLVLATYNVLGHETTSEYAVKSAKRAIKECGSSFIKTYIKTSLSRTSGNLERFGQMMFPTVQQARLFFGDSFSFKRELDENRFNFITEKCFFYEFFKANNHPELTEVMCHWDHNWMEEIKPQKHGFEASHPTSFFFGDPICEYHITRC